MSIVTKNIRINPVQFMSFFFWSSLSLKWTHCRRLASRFSPKSISNDNRVDGFYPRKTTWPNWAKVSFLFYIIIPFSFFGKSGGNRFTAACNVPPMPPPWTIMGEMHSCGQHVFNDVVRMQDREMERETAVLWWVVKRRNAWHTMRLTF